MFSIRRALSVAIFGAATLGASTVSQADTVYIDAGPTGWGCTSCSGGPGSMGLGPGFAVTLVNEGKSGPLQLTLDPGTYSITNAATTGNYSGWRYDGGNDWAWSFVIGADNGNGTATVLHVGWVGAPNHAGQEGVANATGVTSYRFLTAIATSTSTAAYYDTLTLTARTVLDFWIIDYFLPDNIGGVALNISPLSATAVPVPAALPLLGSAIGIAGGFGMWRRRRKAAA